MENKTAIRYGVGVGKEGFKWYGQATIDRKSLWPTLDTAAGNAEAPPGTT